ncbi:hypothetical protein P885DRAFT_64884 [Corynascus similis CBS 632.67]
MSLPLLIVLGSLTVVVSPSPTTLNATAMPAVRQPRPLAEGQHYNSEFIWRFMEREKKPVEKQPAAIRLSSAQLSASSSKAPCTRGKDVAIANILLVLVTFNIKFETRIFPSKAYRVYMAGCYLGRAFTRFKSSERPKALCYEDIMQ